MPFPIRISALSALCLLFAPVGATDYGPHMEPGVFIIAQWQYSGGGDWYASPTAVPNLLRRVATDTPVLAATPKHAPSVQADSPDLFRYPMLFATGHGEIKLTPTEVQGLRTYLLGGGFLHVDDNYGLDESFRREMARVLPEATMLELPIDHPIYTDFYQLPQGLPKIHEHHGGPPHGYGYFVGGRMVCYYTYNTDLGNGWEDEEVYHDAPAKREEALRMGVNIVMYALTH